MIPENLKVYEPSTTEIMSTYKVLKERLSVILDESPYIFNQNKVINHHYTNN